MQSPDLFFCCQHLSVEEWEMMSSDRSMPKVWHLLVKGTPFHEISSVSDLSIYGYKIWMCSEAKSSYSMSVLLIGLILRPTACLWIQNSPNMVSVTAFLWWKTQCIFKEYIDYTFTIVYFHFNIAVLLTALLHLYSLTTYFCSPCFSASVRLLAHTAACPVPPLSVSISLLYALLTSSAGCFIMSP